MRDILIIIREINFSDHLKTTLISLGLKLITKIGLDTIHPTSQTFRPLPGKIGD